jgi:hypothetical protein
MFFTNSSLAGKGTKNIFAWRCRKNAAVSFRKSFSSFRQLLTTILRFKKCAKSGVISAGITVDVTTALYQVESASLCRVNLWQLTCHCSNSSMSYYGLGDMIIDKLRMWIFSNCTAASALIALFFLFEKSEAKNHWISMRNYLSESG